MAATTSLPLLQFRNGLNVPATEQFDPALDAFLYEPSFRQYGVRAPDSDIEVDVVAFTTNAPQDIRTSAIAAFTYNRAPLNACLAAARRLAAPFAMLEDIEGEFDLYHVRTDSSLDTLVRHITSDDIDALRTSELATSLGPRAIHAAKTGIRQLSLFPVDARLLAIARDLSIHSIQSRLEASFTRTQAAINDATTAARIAISAVAALVARDKYNLGTDNLGSITDKLLNLHGSYFEDLHKWQLQHPDVLHDVFEELGSGVDYSTIDARSINAVYERVFLTDDLRKKLGIFHTDLRLATKILEYLPIETIAPDKRYVIDPACGSGNLLLAAIERLENLVPNSLPAASVHQWMQTHIYGSDIEPVAVEVAKLSLLVSSLPHGNSWRIENRDANHQPGQLPFEPSIWVTNPPWRNAKGSRNDVATLFLATAIEHLAEGGIMACILPASWLSAEQHRRSRQELAGKCELLEIWRLPRDMFAPDARFPAAVVFAKKAKAIERTRHLYRWLTASKQHREAFLEYGQVQLQANIQRSKPDAFICSPLERLMNSGNSLGQIATLTGGVVQRGTPEQSHNGGIPYLARGAEVTVYRALTEQSLMNVSTDCPNLLASVSRLDELRSAPKLLIQADRFPDNSWRLRPVVDLRGVVPSNRWQVISTDPREVFALNALCASSIASCIIHSLSATMRITVDVLKHFPLPAAWHTQYRNRFAEVGELMADPDTDIESLLIRSEILAREAYELSAQEIDAVNSIMAGFEAPEGVVRIAEVSETSQGRQLHSKEFNQAPGAVLAVEDSSLRVWVLGGPEDGVEISLPVRMPGSLMYTGATFELTGTLSDGKYTFHRAAHLPDEEVLGVKS